MHMHMMNILGEGRDWYWRNKSGRTRICQKFEGAPTSVKSTRIRSGKLHRSRSKKERKWRLWKRRSFPAQLPRWTTSTEDSEGRDSTKCPTSIVVTRAWSASAFAAKSHATPVVKVSTMIWRNIYIINSEHHSETRSAMFSNKKRLWPLL